MRKSTTKIVKVTIPRVIVDNPMACFSTRDGKWVQEVPVTQQIVKWMKGKNEAYFKLTMSATHIIAMEPTSEDVYMKTKGVKSGVALSNRV